MIRIVTDSSCDLPDALIEQYRLEVVPLTIRFGEDNYVDREELSGDEFWRLLTTGEHLPETAAPSIGRFQEAFNRLASAGADGIVVITISSEMSATAGAAETAADQSALGIPVIVVDSRLVSTALGLVAIEAAEHSTRGAGIDEVAAAAQSASSRSHILATLDTLEFLKRGGRIGGAAAFIGNLLNVKPMIAVTDGTVAAAGRVRTRRKALAEILDTVLEHSSEIERLAVMHGDAEDLDEFLAGLAEIYAGDPIVARLGPVVGTHAGPGLIGIAYRTR